VVIARKTKFDEAISIGRLPRRDYVTPRNDGKCTSSCKYSSLRATKPRGNPCLILITLLILCFNQCQAAIEFDGVNAYIRTSIPRDTSDSTFAYSFWFSTSVPITGSPFSESTSGTNACGTSNGLIGSGALSSPHAGIEVAVGTNGISVSEHGASHAPIVATYSSAISGWTHVVINSSSPSLLELIVNGTQVDTALNTSRTRVLDLTTLGNKFACSPNRLNGSMDDIRVYDRSLTVNEIEILHRTRSKRPSGSLANGLVAHYEMDDDAIGEVTAQAKDSSGNLNHGQFIGFNNLTTALSNDVPVNIGAGTSLKFDGVNDYIDVGDPTNLSFGNSISDTPFSISAWINMKDSIHFPIASKYSGINPNQGEWVFSTIGAGELNFSIIDNQVSNREGISSNTISSYENQWIHVVASYDGRGGSTASNGMNLYLNSQSLATVNTSDAGTYIAMENTPTKVSVGSKLMSYSTPEYANGNIFNLQIFNKILTISEISFLYNGSGLDPGTSNLQALWTFDDDSALKDSSGNDNHGIGFGGESLKYTEGVLRR
jgi:hypothetical protein